MSDGRARARRALCTLGLLTAAWATLLLVSRGVAFSIGPLHISSRNARNPAIGALLVLAIAAWLAPPGLRGRTILGDLGGILRLLGVVAATLPRPFILLGEVVSRPRVLTGLACLPVVLTLALAYTRGAFIAGGADSYGYVSEGHLFATGRLREEVPLANAFPHVPLHAFAPLGYRPAEDGTSTIVPTYAPGLPLVMAVAERFGGMDAAYVVMPLLAAVAVWGAYAIGSHLSGPGVGLGAALLVATSPAFVFQLIGAPMSDVCAAGWWALALALLLRDGRGAVTGAGAAAGMAILTRPNLLLVVVVLGSYLLWSVVRERNRREPLTRLVLFSVPVVVACLTVAGFNAAWYGSPFRSGYPPGLFSARYWIDNVSNYPRWLIETQTPLLFVGFAAPFAARWLPGHPVRNVRAGALLLIATVPAVLASYLFYMPFDAWWYLRFLLPGLPALAVATCLTLAALTARFGLALRVVSVAAVVAAAAFGWSMIAGLETLGENRYRIIGEWVRTHLPGNAVVIAMQHGGNIKLYSGREIVRYDGVAKGDFEAAVDDIIAAGYRPYLVIDEWEVPHVRQLHGAGPRGAIDWPPIALLPLANVTVWDLGEDRAAARASQRTPQIIPIPEWIRRQLP